MSVMKRWARLTWPGGFKVGRRDNLLWLLNYRNYVDRQLGLFGGWEPQQLAYLLERMRPGCDGFLDIGANFGLYALRVAQSGLASEIHAFEPDPRNYAQLGGNLYMNRQIGKVHAHPLALSDACGPLAFTLSPENWTGMSRVVDAEDANVTVAGSTLDQEFRWSGKRLMLKIDVEGHEIRVVRGGERLLRNNSCFIQVEAWPQNAQALKDEFQRQGYRLIHQIEDDLYFANRT